MKAFTHLYEGTIALSRRPRARAWLGVVSFSESSFFIVPPDVMLLPMSIAQPTRWLHLAALTTITSVAGGVVGYFIGLLVIDSALPLINDAGYGGAYKKTIAWFEQYGAWAILIAGFTPVPYKIFTVASGAFGVFLPLFIVMSLLGRGARFFAVAFIGSHFATAVIDRLYRHLEIIGWGTVIAILAYGAYYFFL